MTLHHEIIKYNRIIDIQIKDASSGPKVETKLNYYHVIMSHKRSTLQNKSSLLVTESITDVTL